MLPGQFNQFIHRVEALTVPEINAIVNAVPSEWRPAPDDSSLLAPFLIERKEQLRHLLPDTAASFPNMVQGGNDEM